MKQTSSIMPPFIFVHAQRIMDIQYGSYALFRSDGSIKQSKLYALRISRTNAEAVLSMLHAILPAFPAGEAYEATIVLGCRQVHDLLTETSQVGTDPTTGRTAELLAAVRHVVHERGLVVEYRYSTWRKLIGDRPDFVDVWG